MLHLSQLLYFAMSHFRANGACEYDSHRLFYTEKKDEWEIGILEEQPKARSAIHELAERTRLAIVELDTCSGAAIIARARTPHASQS
ncbi:hypothetical protein TKK_0018706 [Trichogramma kaykai]